LLGFMFHWGLFGALCVQVYIYHLAFQRDPRRNKFLVFTVFAIELAQTIFFTDSAFYIFGDGFGNFQHFEDIKFTWFSAPLMTGIVAFIAQIFYAYRISILARSYHAGSIILLLGHDYSISAGVYPPFPHIVYPDLTLSCFQIWNGTSALCDVIIAFAMTYYASISMKSTKVILKGIIALVIETGTITGSSRSFSISDKVPTLNNSY
ncbi:hypothetical protein GALMADRAFT_63064, partial [Galerina marginata CBS 339.88]